MGSVLDYLQRAGFLNKDERLVFSSTWGFLCAGGHPGISDHDEKNAHLSMILALTFGHAALLKLQKWAISYFADPQRSLPAARAVQGRAQSSAIAVGGGGSRDELLELMQAGIQDVVPQFTYREVWQAANRAASNLACAGQSLADVYSFVPAKPGCGATTLATNATAMAARLADQPTYCWISIFGWELPRFC